MDNDDNFFGSTVVNVVRRLVITGFVLTVLVSAVITSLIIIIVGGALALTTFSHILGF